MPEIREDPLTGTSVIIAANRDDRPYEFEIAVPRRLQTRCPFCLGNEDETPAELARYTNGRLNGTSPWSVRVVPNKYPAVLPDATGFAAKSKSRQAVPAFGRHEVIVESPQHKTCFCQLTASEARLACEAYRDRLQAAKDTNGVKFAHVFKNTGPAAGASLEHVHSQLIALPAVPTRVLRMLENTQRLIQTEGKSVFAEMLGRELESGERIIEQTDTFIAHCPYAARFPFETRITPLDSASDFLQADRELLHELADLLQRTVRRIELVSGRAAYNFSLNVPPFDAPTSQHFQWQLDIFPRLSTPAGFEWATGWFINPVAPEDSARLLREAVIADADSQENDISSGNNC
jgi:UDPglucose--hexose-1-phosphate uridylyltransferase